MEKAGISEQIKINSCGKMSFRSQIKAMMPFLLTKTCSFLSSYIIVLHSVIILENSHKNIRITEQYTQLAHSYSEKSLLFTFTIVTQYLISTNT